MNFEFIALEQNLKHCKGQRAFRGRMKHKSFSAQEQK